ncbi:MAG TPA: ABC transporter ATP-binding protein/permease [Chloroflexi bacterium]|nr:ABC transporter ATP-binding protein/permease [Chloroflexota bacterium]
MSYAIETWELTKWFPRFRHLSGLRLPFPTEGGILAVDHVNLQVKQGEIFGLIGPNGAGKTTLVKMLCTLILPTSGTAQVNGHDLSDESGIKASIGLVTGNERSFYWRLSCRENLRFYAGLYNIPPSQAERRIEELSHLLGLEEILDKRFDTCSTGMKHRLALARALLNEPSLLFLDEPTRSLDPLAAIGFRKALHELARQKGCTIFLVTHNLNEAIELCDRIGVMVQGQLRVVTTPESLRRLVELREELSLSVGINSAEAAPEPGIEGEPWEKLLQELSEGEERGIGSRKGEPSFGGAEQLSVAPSIPPKVGKGGQETRSLANLLRAFHKALLFLRRDFLIQLSYRFAFILQLFGILFSTASFYFIAKLFGSATAPYLSNYGGDYFSFVLIGIAFVGYQGVALHSFSDAIRTGQVTGTLEAMLVTPTRLSTLLLSSSLWNFVLTSLRVVIYLLMGIFLFGANLRQANVLAALVILGLSIPAFSALGILSASFIMVFKRGDPINFLISSLSVLLGGVYYPVAVLPQWLQILARILPITYSLEAMRRALLLGDSLITLMGEIAALIAFAAVLWPLSLLAFHYAVRQAKRDGSLAQY